MVLQPGVLVTDNVTLVRPLGRGGMGSVWVAHHQSLDAEVAVKFVLAELAAKDATVVTRFQREAGLSAKIKSPHVVKTFDHGVTDDGHPYIVMELLEGETLGEYLAEHQRLEPRDVAVIVSQIASVLDEAHALGVVHRDIKPDNVFLVDAGYDVFVKVLDFGIAKQTDVPKVSDVTSTGAIVGTPEYMSPEQLLSTKTADYTADLWSLAVLAYHALSGEVPFKGETLPSLSVAICSGRYEPATTLNAALPAGVDGWFERCFERDVERRFRKAAEMADGLRNILVGDGDPERSSRPRPGSGKRRKQGSSKPPESDERDKVESDPDADSMADTVREDGHGTLASPGARRGASGPKGPVVAVEQAPDTGSTGLLERERKGSATFSGAELGPASHGRSLLLGAVLLFAAAITLVVGLRDPGPKPAPAGSSRAVSDPWDEPEADRTTAAPAATSAAPAEALEPEPPATASAHASAKHPGAQARPKATARAQASATASTRAGSASKAGCEHPYYTDSEGILQVKPECRKQ